MLFHHLQRQQGMVQRWPHAWENRLGRESPPLLRWLSWYVRWLQLPLANSWRHQRSDPGLEGMCPWMCAQRFPGIAHRSKPCVQWLTRITMVSPATGDPHPGRSTDANAPGNTCCSSLDGPHACPQCDCAYVWIYLTCLCYEIVISYWRNIKTHDYKSTTLQLYNYLTKLVK